MNENNFSTWTDQDSSSKEQALSEFSNNVDSYAGLGKTTGSSYRHFIDIESNRSVRPGFNASDYYAFPP